MASWTSSFGSITAQSNAFNGPNDSCGAEANISFQYQCVELVTRWFHENLGLPFDALHTIPPPGIAGPGMCGAYSGDGNYAVYTPNTGAPEPVPGDALVWNGHTALVIQSDSSNIGFLEQNYTGGNADYTAQANVSWNGATFGAIGGMSPSCWIHPNKIGSGAGSSSTGMRGQLARYYNSSTGDHWSTNDDPPPGYHLEGSLGFILPTQIANTHALYSCQIGGDEFTSPDANCEGQRVLRTLGWVYSSPPANMPVQPVYRCRVTSSGEHFDSLAANCEGQTVESVLGYTTAKRTLGRYYNSSIPDHGSTTGDVPQGYHYEGSLGLILSVGGANLQPLYACMIGNDEFTSPSSNCEGQQVLAWIGNAYASPPANIPNQAVYRCTVNGTGEHFDSNDINCEGQHAEFRLGYTEAKEPLTRYYNPTTGDHGTGVLSVPAGYHFEYQLGTLLKTPPTNGVPLYGCMIGTDEFTSTDSNCEGQTVLGPLGWAYGNPPSGVPVNAMYRCRVTGTGEHFDSVDSNCEGQTVEFLFGYLPIEM
jgi:hypothetical protein